MINSLVGSIMNMTADVYIQQNAQTKSGNLDREWLYSFKISCKVEPLKSGGALNRADNKTFMTTGADDYLERFQLKMKSPVQLSRRYRVRNIRNHVGEVAFVEFDRYDKADMIFDVTSSHPEIDPLGHISYYETTLARVLIQHNDTNNS